MSERWLLVSSGQGPAECRWVVARLTEDICREAAEAGLGAAVVDTEPCERDLPRSAIVRLSGDTAPEFADHLEGTVQWIGQSPFRPGHRRKNWFVGVFLLPAPEDVPGLEECDVSFQVMRATGPGGQHVNTTESAVRATHTPSGIVVVARDERSQHANRRLALAKIAAELCRRGHERAATRRQESWNHHRNVERGRPVRIYDGPGFKLRRER